MATSSGSPQTPIRARGSKNCSSHHGKEVVFYCKNCDKLSCADCAIQECQGHLFEGISNIIPGAKQKLQNFLQKVEVTDIPHMRLQLQDVDNALSKTRKDYKEKISNIKQQNETLKKELDKIADTWVKTCQGMEQQSLDKLHIHKKTLQERIDKLSSRLQEIRKTLQSGHDILVFDTSNAIRSEFVDLPTPICSTVEFNQGNIQLLQLEQLFGEMRIKAADNQSDKLFNSPGKWKVMSKFTPYTDHRVKSIRAVGKDQAWLCFANTNKKFVEKMILTDQSGRIKESLDMDVRVFDICLSPKTGNIWFCSGEDNSIREVKGGKSVIRFKTDTSPNCICITKDDHIIIGHPRQAVKYTQEGQVICGTAGGNPCETRTPYHLSECPLTSNLAVVHKNIEADGGNGTATVSILNDQLQFFSTYNSFGHNERSPFRPHDVCYTAEGEIVITDLHNRSVLLSTATGRYSQTLFKEGRAGAVAICVHSGALWVSFLDGSVQVLRNSLN